MDLTHNLSLERDRESLAIFQKFELGFGLLIFCIGLSVIFSRPLSSAVGRHKSYEHNHIATRDL